MITTAFFWLPRNFLSDLQFIPAAGKFPEEMAQVWVGGGWFLLSVNQRDFVAELLLRQQFEDGPYQPGQHKFDFLSKNIFNLNQTSQTLGIVRLA